MIKNIHARGRYMQVMGGSASTYVNASYGAQGVGNLRFNTSSQCLEVYDGTTWTILNLPDATVGLNDEAESLLDWAKEKKQKEKEYKEWALKHPMLQSALKDLHGAQERLEVIAILCQQEEKLKENV